MGSGGGGSTSGATDFPQYMKNLHSEMMNHGGTDTIFVSAIHAYNYATSGNSPFYNYLMNSEPIAQAFMGGGKTINNYPKIFELLNVYQNLNFDTLLASYNSTSTVDALIRSVSTSLDDDITNNILPKFKGNMRSIGAVMASNYVVGEALIWDSKLKALAKERLTIEQVAQQGRELALRSTLAFMEFKRTIVTTTSDIVKYYYAMKTELDDHYSGMLAKDYRWDLELSQYVNNTLASISGAALSQGTIDKPPSKVASALGGALSGAAMGGAAGGAPGAVIGGVVGLAGSLLSN